MGKKYAFVQLKDDCKIPNLNSQMPKTNYTREEKTTQLLAFVHVQRGSDVVKERNLHIEREGDELHVRSVHGGYTQVIPWANVRHAVEEPAEAPQKGKGAA